MRSGEYPQKKSSLNLSPLCSSSGTQISSVTPGYTVLSYTTISPFFSTLATLCVAFTTGVKSGRLFLSIGVGTVTIKKLHSFISSKFRLNFIPFSIAFFICSALSSSVRSYPLLSSSMRAALTSKPVTSYFSLNAAANGSPTYPSPITAIFIYFSFLIFLVLSFLRVHTLLFPRLRLAEL